MDGGHVLRLHVVQTRDRRSRGDWGHGLPRGLRNGGNRRRRVPRLFPPSNAGLPARGWRVEDRPSPRKRHTGTLAMTHLAVLASEPVRRGRQVAGQLPGFAVELNGVMQDCTADATEATTREDASARTSRNRVRTHRDPRDHPVDRSDLLLLASRVAGSPARMHPETAPPRPIPGNGASLVALTATSSH